MDPYRADFLKTYARALRLGDATAFVGAGLSRPAGYPDWRGLVRVMAQEMGLDPDEAHDLPALVQFFLTEEGQRGRLNAILNDRFIDEKPIPDAVSALTRLPLREIWTTNYDTLIERAVRQAGRKASVKWSDDQLTTSTPFLSTTVFKMHGSIEQPAGCVIARDDFERYRLDRPGFHHTIAERLQSKRFLFLGAGLNDPNLNNLFSLVREMHGPNTRPHTAVMRRGRPGGDPRDLHEARTQELWFRELKRYGVHVVYVDEFDEIPMLLEDLRRRVLRETVFVSGAHPSEAAAARKGDVLALGRLLGSELARRKMKIVSGFGNTVGGAVISGALDELYQDGTTDLEHALGLRPFPQELEGGERERVYAVYRRDMVRQAGLAIFVSGLEPSGGDAPGVLQEFDIAVSDGLLPIPIGATGGAAATVWQRMSADYASLSQGMDRALFDALNDVGKTASEMLTSICRILDWWTGEAC